MPSNHIEWRKILFCGKQFTAKLLHNGIPWMEILFKPSRGDQKIPWSSKTISTYTMFKNLLPWAHTHEANTKISIFLEHLKAWTCLLKLTTYRAKIRKLEMGTENLRNITSRRTIWQINRETKSLRQNNNLTRRHLQSSTFSCDPQPYIKLVLEMKFPRRAPSLQ